MPKRKKRWLLGSGLITGLMLLMASHASAGPLLPDKADPCACFFMMILAVIVLLQAIPAAIMFLCLTSVLLVLLYKFYKDRHAAVSPSSDKGK
jgi:hypothetical protein